MEEKDNCCIDLQKIKTYREKLNLNIKELSVLSNINYVTCFRMVSFPDYGGDNRKLKRIAKVLGLNYKELLLDDIDNSTITD